MTDNLNRKLAALMFADIVSYSRLMGSNEGEALKLLEDFENISAEIVREYEGVIIKKRGYILIINKNLTIHNIYYQYKVIFSDSVR